MKLQSPLTKMEHFALQQNKQQLAKFDLSPTERLYVSSSETVCLMTAMISQFHVHSQYYIFIRDYVACIHLENTWLLKLGLGTSMQWHLNWGHGVFNSSACKSTQQRQSNRIKRPYEKKVSN